MLDDRRMRTAVVTGASGFVGSHLVRALLEQGIIVYGVGRSAEKLATHRFDSGFIPIVADFGTYDSLKDLIQEDSIDVFYHMAWQGGFTSALKDYRLQLMNAEAACGALSAAAELGCKKFVYAGTVNELEVNSFLTGERCIPRNTCIYGAAKAAGDVIARTLAYNNRLEYCSALLPMMYGRGNASPQIINIVIKNCYTGVPSKLIEGINRYDVVHINDVVCALCHIGQSGANMREYYIGHRALRTFREIMVEIRDILNPAAELRFGEYEDSLNLDYSLIDLDTLYRDTGFECCADFAETIKDQAEWLKEIHF